MIDQRQTIRGTARERTSLAWWRTAQAALGCAALLAKVSLHGPAVGWSAAGLALLVAAVSWHIAHRRAHQDANLRATQLIVVGALCLSLTVAVLALVVVAT